jgi:glutathione S-transferase
MADAHYAPVCTRLQTYDVGLSPGAEAYRDAILAMEPMREWIDAATAEPDEVQELEMEF